mmetsp:Transcript_29476/g.41484  ORF Transcript_29476/g.41484 Transcript_29476/m.41484 type:complete len:468 (-) Transcript_29476:30-1433(-)
MAQLNRGWMVVGVISLLLVLLVAIAIGIAFTHQNMATGAIPYKECNGITDTLTNGLTPEGYCAYVWSENVNQPRALLPLDNGDIIALERGASQISIHWDDDGDGVSGESEHAVLVRQSGLNHAVRFRDGYLYASTQNTVYRWPYSGGRDPITAAAEVVVANITGGGHSTRPMEFDSSNRMYVNIGSAGNVDSNTVRSSIKRFNLTSVPTGGFDWEEGEIYVYGMRNEVGIRMDANGFFWGVENGVDDLEYNNQDIHEDNPCEELNAFGNPDQMEPGNFYGYPYCWSEYKWADGDGEGSQWVQTEYATTYNNTWCKNTTNVKPPALCFPAHNAPLDILFYYPSTANSTLESDFIKSGDAFVTLHGSKNRDVRSGYRVVRVSFNATDPSTNFVNSTTWPIAFEPLLYYAGDPGSPYLEYPNEQYGDGWIRPVGLAVSSKCGKNKDSECLLVSSNKSTATKIVAVTKRQY